MFSYLFVLPFFPPSCFVLFLTLSPHAPTRESSNSFINLKNFVLFIFLSLPQKYKFLKWRPTSDRQVQYRILCISLQKKGHGPSTAECENYCSQDQNDQAQVYRRNTHLLISFKSSEEILNVKTWKLKFQEVWNLSCNLSREQASAYFRCNSWDWIVWDGHCPWTDPLLLSQAGMVRGVFSCGVKCTTCLGFCVC